MYQERQNSKALHGNSSDLEQAIMKIDGSQDSKHNNVAGLFEKAMKARSNMTEQYKHVSRDLNQQLSVIKVNSQMMYHEISKRDRRQANQPQSIESAKHRKEQDSIKSAKSGDSKVQLLPALENILGSQDSIVSNASCKPTFESYQILSEQEMQAKENDLLIQQRFKDILYVGTEDSPFKSPVSSLSISFSPVLVNKIEKKQNKYPALIEDKEMLMNQLQVKNLAVKKLKIGI